ncbi:hypothetical protein Hamer_G016742, partial [Homarus americanus]
KRVLLPRKYAVNTEFQKSASDIRKYKDKLHKYAMKFNVDQEKSGIRRMRKVGNEDLEEAVYKCSYSNVREKFKDLMDAKNFQLCQLYNADETGLFWRALLKNIQASRSKKVCPVGNFQKSECLQMPMRAICLHVQLSQFCCFCQRSKGNNPHQILGEAPLRQ